MMPSEPFRWGSWWLSPKRRTALCGFVFGAGLCLVLVAAPIWLVGRGSSASVAVQATPLSALSTTPAVSPQFDISAILSGEWRGEMCPDDGVPMPVAFEFVRDGQGEVFYSMTIGGEFQSAGIVGSGACDVSGEDLAFHAFLAILNDCDDACGVDRVYEGHFEEGALVGNYRDQVSDDVCSSCVGGGTWWLAPAS